MNTTQWLISTIILMIAAFVAGYSYKNFEDTYVDEIIDKGEVAHAVTGDVVGRWVFVNRKYKSGKVKQVYRRLLP